ncbi:MAG TPA: BsuPI-related putative proteinase inhibitor [Longimicrobiales bacterium]|nr:BsuPI-related putative proteinase inhibitor [Longimicrobiales bacterium]
MTDSLQLTTIVQTPVPAGERAAITLTAVNVSGRPLELYLAGREPTADVVVRDAAGAVIWQKLRGAAVQAIVQLKLLPAGDSLTLHESWDVPDTASGEYLIEAVLLTDAAPLRFPRGRITVGR